MAATQESNGTVFQAWFPHPLDEQLRKHAESERRSLSQTIRLAQLRQNTGEGPAPLGGDLSFPPRRRRADIDVKSHRPITIASLEC
jgi:hypothetical protein